MNPMIQIRDYSPDDASDCVAIYNDAVRNGTAPYYTAEEAAAWAPLEHDLPDWTERLGRHHTYLANSQDGPQGFLTLTGDGHLDLFFVRPAARALGTAPMLYDRMIAEAQSIGLPRLTTHASHLARRFLERRGWTVTEEERTRRHGVWLTRFRMDLAEVPVGATETRSWRVTMAKTTRGSAP